MSEFVTSDTLIDVSKNGKVLTLLDGSKWEVRPSDTPTVCTWIPTTSIEISLDDDHAYPYILTNGEGISVRASQKY